MQEGKGKRRVKGLGAGTPGFCFHLLEATGLHVFNFRVITEPPNCVGKWYCSETTRASMETEKETLLPCG